jgi:hypothetical protein
VGDPEITQLRLAVVVDKHIGGFDIAVQSAALVRGFQRPAQFHTDPQCLGPRDWAFTAQPDRQGIRGVVGHHDVWPPTLGYADSQDVDDVRMPREPAHRIALAQKAFPAVFVEMRWQHYYCDISPKRRLVAAIDHPGAAPSHLARIFESGGGQLPSEPARSRRRTISGRSFSHFWAPNLSCD